MNSMNGREVREMLLAAADRIIRIEPYLTRVDSAIGDGDHGIGMKNGMTAARAYLTGVEDPSDIGALFGGMADAMRQAMGGASGMIFSALFAGGSAHPAGRDLTPVDLARQMAAGLQSVQALGRAQPGDKTMVDALAPAAAAMAAHTDSFEALLNAAAEAAEAGMEKTKEYTARFGRAKNLGERAIGHPDPGAVSTWQIFTALRDYVTGEQTPDPVLPAEEEKAVGGGPRKMLLNDPADAVREEAEGFLAAYGRDYMAVPGVNGLVRREIPAGKTALVIGGGSGHEPMFGFLLGENLADAAANGNVFTSPDPVTIEKTAEAAQRGGGVLFLYGNYAGDNMNFDLAAEQLAARGIPSRTIRVRDDVASAPRSRLTDRRGIAGDLFMLKIAGAACAQLPLDKAWRVAQKANDNLWTVGVGLAGATIPGQREPIFTLPEDEMEYGLGIHGEPGVRREKLQKADKIAETLLAAILEDSGLGAGDTVCTYVNGLGSTTLMELMILNRRLRQLLDEKGIRVYDMEVNSLVTTMEMAGASITLLRLDEELRHYYDMPCRSPYYNKF